MSEQQLGAGIDEAAAELSGGFVRRDREPRRCEDGAGVEAGFELHEAHTSLEVTGKHRPLYGCRASPPRQEREVNVHESVGQRLEQRHRQQLPERNNDAELGAARAHVVHDLPRLFGRTQLQAEHARGPLDR